jgi:hypothetical protein
MQNLLQYRGGLRRIAGGGKPSVWRLTCLVIALVAVATVSGLQAKAQSTGDPTPNALELGPRCPTCPIVIPSRPLSAKDKEDREQRRVEKRDFSIANATRKKYIDDEANKVVILARDLKAKVDALGGAKPTPTMLREAAVIEFLAKDIKEKMNLTVNPE